MTQSTDVKPLGFETESAASGASQRPARQNPLRWPLTIAAAAVVVVGAGFLAAPLVLERKPPAGLLTALDLPTEHCGTKLIAFQPGTDRDDAWVFPINGTWHHTRPCLDSLLVAAADRPADAPIHDFIWTQVLYILSQEPVRFYERGVGTLLLLPEVLDRDRQLDFSRFNRVVYVNKRDLAHNSMSHVDLTIWLFAAAEQYLAGENSDPTLGRTYQALGEAVISVILDTVPEKGLRSRAQCDLRPELHCSLFHAVTNPHRRTSDTGGTLNKNLQAIRDLNRSSNTLERIQMKLPEESRQALIDKLRAAAAEGINQLVYSTGLKGPAAMPNLADYIPTNADGRPVQNSWLYYAINVRKQDGYFLRGNVFKNCSYHIKDMLHLYMILNEAGHLTETSGFRDPSAYLGGQGVLDYIVKTYTDKLEDGGLYTDSPTDGDGNYLACKDGYKDPAPQAVVDYLRDF